MYVNIILIPLLPIFFFEEYVRIKIEDHKIPFLTNRLSPKLDEINGVNVIPSCETYDLRVFYQFTA